MSRTRWMLASLFVGLLTASPLLAQATGRITGTVRDASGAVVRGVTVTATHQGAGSSRTALTAADGTFAMADLATGPYTVAATLLGFRKVEQKNVQVASGAAATADFTVEALLAEEITVTGTRVKGRTAIDTAAPVDIIDNLSIRSVGSTETGKILQLLEPSVNFSTTYISDGTDIVRPVTLRALGPDQTLVLVNGKRRHQQSLIHIQQTVARGAAGYDINSIPSSAIDHIEVLRDGAAAQYGSDAIAGVVNIILKERTDATDITLEGGQHYAENSVVAFGSPDSEGGHGRTLFGSVNTGFKIKDRGFVNLTGEHRDRGETNRAGLDSLRASPPAVLQRIGDPKARDTSLWLNSFVPAGQGAVYAFGGWSNRKGNSSGFFRTRGDGRTVPDIYPQGFLPTIVTEPTDLSAAVGYRGTFGSNWTWDLGGNWGSSEFKFREENTVNVSYYYEPTDPSNPTGPRFRDSPTSADTGTLIYDQIAAGVDLVGVVDWGVGEGKLNVALGTEWRRERYEIKPGEPVSFQYGRTNNGSIRILDQTGGIAAAGTQGFPGFQDAVDEDRSNIAVYADLESQISRKFLAAVAARFENYSDFGSTVTGKASARADITDRFAVRGTLATGFRAPGVQQLFFTLRSTNLNAAGVLTDTLTARSDSAVTGAFGLPALGEETSRNYSVGVVARPADRFRITVDAYRIDIDDRIIFSSNVQPSTPAIADILAPFRVGQVQFFTNAIDTKTDGLDIVALYDWDLGSESSLSLEGALHFNDVKVKNRKSASAILPADVLFDRAQVRLVEEGQPGKHYVASGTYRRSGWSGNVRFNYFGEVSGEGFTGVNQTWGGKWLTDASLTVPIKKDRVSLTVGGLNIFDVYPDEWDPREAPLGNFPFPQLGFIYGWETLPFGINGGYYYARLNVRLNH